MRVALIPCTSRKKAYKCPARDLYSESPRFQLAYALAKLVADKIFILSAKYGLVLEDTIIEPYNETLKGKSVLERRAWGEKVLNELRKVSDLESDEFIVLAGKVYHENLVPNMTHFWLPLKGKRQGEWIHKQMGMKNRMPEICRIMYEKMMPGDEVLHTTPSGKSSTIKIRYYIKNQ